MPPFPPPQPLPPYVWSSELDEDENYLTWSVLVARHSFSKRGHMGALVVAPSPFSPPSSSPHDPLNSSSSSSSGSGITTSRDAATSRILVYAVNTPLLYNAGHPRNVPEIHAEAHCVSLAARHGTSLSGCSIYVTFPPCLECFKLLIAAGIRRCVYRKSYPLHCSDALLVTAEVFGVELKGTTVGFLPDPLHPWDETVVNDTKSAVEALGVEQQAAQLAALLSIPVEELDVRQKVAIGHLSWLADRRSDRERDERARTFWANQPGESSAEARQRSVEWWERWQRIYKDAARKLRSQNRGGFMEKERKAEKKERIEKARGSSRGTAATPPMRANDVDHDEPLGSDANATNPLPAQD